MVLRTNGRTTKALQRMRKCEGIANDDKFDLGFPMGFSCSVCNQIDTFGVEKLNLVLTTFKIVSLSKS